MARPKKDSSPDTSKAMELTVGAIERLTCPPGKAQAFLRDTKAPRLAVRVMPARTKPDGTVDAAKSFVFRSKLAGKFISRTIGDPREMTIATARDEANRLAVLLSTGTDPRELERQQAAEKESAARAAAEKMQTEGLTVGEAWAHYVAERTPHWGEHHRNDHARLTRAGGVKANRGTRGTGQTKAGPLHHFMGMRLVDVTEHVVDAWAVQEAASRPTVARLALRLLRAFLAWAGSPKRYGHVVSGNAAKSPEAREAIGPANAKRDSLLREQLPQWFTAVRAVRNQAAAAYLQAMLLTGARPGEMLALRWDDISTSRRSMTLDDKVDGTGRREIPLTPYLASLLQALPRRGDWVFAAGRVLSMDPAAVRRRERRGSVAVQTDKPMDSPNEVLTAVCAAAGVEHVTLHGLRRSFRTLSEWLEVPTGVVAQIEGHKPSATIERHYTVRPLDLLRVHHERMEREFLAWGGIEFVAPETAKPTPLLRVVSAS